MAEREHPPAQPTQPKGIDPKTGKPYEAVEIPVPAVETVERLLANATGAFRIGDRVATRDEPDRVGRIHEIRYTAGLALYDVRFENAHVHAGATAPDLIAKDE